MERSAIRGTQFINRDGTCSHQEVGAVIGEILRLAGIKRIVLDYPFLAQIEGKQRVLIQQIHSRNQLILETTEPSNKQLNLFKEDINVQYW